MGTRISRSATTETHGIDAGAIDRPGKGRLTGSGWHRLIAVSFLGGLLATVAVDPARAQTEHPRIEEEVCAGCHETAQLRSSVHGDRVACLSCHAADSHRTMPRDPVEAGKARSQLCLECHVDTAPAHAPVAGGPVCTDCHSAHTDPAIAQAGPLIARRCGSCHEAELTEFMDGGHSASLALDAPNPDVPSCLTCHPAHGEASTARPNTRLEATTLCIRCHSDRTLIASYDLPGFAAESYADDFHGATLQSLREHPDGVAQPDVLVCSDCHGAHKVEWIAQADVVGVCLGCHQDADAKIAGAWLGHDRVGRDNAVLVWAIRLFYYSFVPVVLGGLLLTILIEISHQRRLRRSGNGHGHGDMAGFSVTRFNRTERIEHLLAMTSFTLLVVTGLPQIWPESTVGGALIGLWGGIGMTRIIHRVTGVAFVGLLVLHVGRALVRVVRSHRAPIMFATRKDFRDTLQTIRHFLGTAPAPRIGKFDFRAKFEYWGLFLGGTLMSVTGFMLLFPELFSWLIPGSVIAAGRELHGLEGTFAVLVVILWHSWTVILRPEIFPLDKSIFTGKMAVGRLREEHPLEYERIFGAQPAVEAVTVPAHDDAGLAVSGSGHR